jgi:hypothetical protein
MNTKIENFAKNIQREYPSISFEISLDETGSMPYVQVKASWERRVSTFRIAAMVSEHDLLRAAEWEIHDLTLQNA